MPGIEELVFRSSDDVDAIDPYRPGVPVTRRRIWVHGDTPATHRHTLHNDGVERLRDLCDLLGADRRFRTMARKDLEGVVLHLLGDIADDVIERNAAKRQLLARLDAAKRDFHLLTPISGLRIDSPVALGLVTIYPSHGAAMVAVGATERDAETWSQDVVVGPVAAVPVSGSQTYAMEAGIERIDAELDLVRFFCREAVRVRRPPLLEIGARIEGARAMERGTHLIEVGAHEVDVSRFEAFVRGDLTWSDSALEFLSSESRRAWEVVVDSWRIQQVGGPPPRGFGPLRSCIRAAARASEAVVDADVLLFSVVSIEAIADFGDGAGVGDISERTSERAAFLNSDSPGVRRATYDAVRKAYGQRSTIVHGGAPDLLGGFADLVRDLALQLPGLYVARGLHLMTDEERKAWHREKRFETSASGSAEESPGSS